MTTRVGHEVRGVSIGGLQTRFELPGWKLCFDQGTSSETAVRLPTILITHAHVDHLGGIARHCATRDLLGMGPPTYVIPAENEAAFHDLLDAWRRLDRSPLPCEVVAVRPGDVVPLGRRRLARVFRSVHRVPSVGYALCRRVERLKPEFHGLEGREIGRLRRDGVEIHDEEEVAEIAFCGDTTIDVVEREALVRQARLLLLECTFLDDRVSVDKARGQGHVHLDELVERAELFANEHIWLTHFSARYSAGQVRSILEERLPSGLAGRVEPWLEGHRDG